MTPYLIIGVMILLTAMAYEYIEFLTTSNEEDFWVWFGNKFRK